MRKGHHSITWSLIRSPISCCNYAVALSVPTPSLSPNVGSPGQKAEVLISEPLFSSLPSTIASGRVFQVKDFLNEEEIQIVLQDIRSLESLFSKSGLSNTSKGNRQSFGNQDRSICAIPWWNMALNGQMNVEEHGTIATIGNKLQRLRISVSEQLGRPTMKDVSLAHECYYSISTIGSWLSRHLDERHEEFKGNRGWLLPRRRSISWLIYLSDPGWNLDDNGGALRSFPQLRIDPAVAVGSHDGNLQVGWLRNEHVNDSSTFSWPVFMDCWVEPATSSFKRLSDHNSDPHCVLYTVVNQKRRVLTKPWRTESIQQLAGGKTVADFIQSCARQDAKPRASSAPSPSYLFLSPTDAQNFALIEDRPGWEKGMLPEGSVPTDISPERRSLVMFDSVAVPHQVDVVKKGSRIALAKRHNHFPILSCL